MKLVKTNARGKFGGVCVCVCGVYVCVCPDGGGGVCEGEGVYVYDKMCVLAKHAVGWVMKKNVLRFCIISAGLYKWDITILRYRIRHVSHDLAYQYTT